MRLIQHDLLIASVGCGSLIALDPEEKELPLLALDKMDEI
jgi:hypothetical protein